MAITEQEIQQEIDFLRTKGEVLALDGKEWTILEGDLPLDEIELHLYARKRLEAQQADQEDIEPFAGRPLMAKVDENGSFMRWRRGLTLSYTILKQTFETAAAYEAVVRAMDLATADWQALCNVHFAYRPEFDELDDAPQEILFTVRYHQLDPGKSTIARAFFPDYDEEDRIVYIFPKWYTTSFDRVGIMRHELGHVLGFRHEHIREEAPYGCPDEALHNAVALGLYDPQSVMHYPCAGLGTTSLAFTDFDRQGSWMVYGAPDEKCIFFG